MCSSDDNRSCFNKEDVLNWDVFDQFQRERTAVVSSIDTILRFSNSSSALEEVTTEEGMFIETALKINKIYLFNAMAFYGINKNDQDFYMSYCNSPDWSDFFEKNRISLIDDGTFSWLLERERPVILPSLEGKFSLFLSPLATRKRIMGFFIAVIDKNKKGLDDILNSFIFLVLKMVSISLQNLDLYNLVQELNKDLKKKVEDLTQSEISLMGYKETLEKTVKTRTSALEKANVDLLTEKHKVEKANRAKSIFLSNMSHEIRTPISQMIGMTSLALNVQGIPPVQKGYLKNSLLAGRSLLTLVENLLEFSRLETENVYVSSEACNLKDVCSFVVEKIKKEQILDQLNVKIVMDDNIPPRLSCDSTKLKQILLNIMNNAVKFTEKGSITLTGKLVGMKSKEAMIELSIKDTGVGIPLEKQKSIFDLFFQGDSSHSKKYGGTGLGLAISKKLVELLGGDIRVESSVEEGSNFVVQLQLTVLNDLVEGADRIFEKNDELLDGLSVLLVEDNLLNRKLAQAVISGLNWYVDEAEDGFGAVRAVQNKKYDLILMDIQMPGMNGIEATKKIREMKENEINRPVIIALTANATMDDRSVCMEAGMDEYLTKPINKSKMTQTVVGLLKLSSFRKG